MNLIFCYSKCSTCKRAIDFLNRKKVTYELRDIKENNPSKEELEKLVKLSNVDINKFFNTSGLVYRNLNLKDKIKSMTYEEKLNILSSDGMLIKRPIFIFNNEVLLGFNEKYWNDKIK